MKALYKMILFFAIFQVTVLMVNSMNIFPSESTFYNDMDTDEYDLSTAEGIVKFLFPAINGEDLTVSLLVGGFTTLGVLFGLAVSIATKSLAPLVISILGASMIPMVMNSWKIFNKIFYEFDSAALQYLGLCLGVGIIVIAIITILEMPTHGRSGS
jgi:hypothetical protein